MKSADGIFLALWFKLGGVKGFAVSMAACSLYLPRFIQPFGRFFGTRARVLVRMIPTHHTAVRSLDNLQVSSRLHLQ